MIYADNAATTRVKPEVLEAMLPYFCESYANPSSLYPFAYEAKSAIERARGKVAELINADESEIYFTSCGTESDNWAIKCSGAKHIVTSKIEHHAILYACKAHGNASYAEVDEHGFVIKDSIKDAMCEDTGLVSVMYANNEIGTIEPVDEIAKIAHERGALFHTDAVQAAGHIPIDVKKSGIDMLSISGHKFGAPKGIGVMYIKKGVKIPPLLNGGGHERGKRSGTENTPYIVGLGVAAELAKKNMDKNIPRVRAMRDKILRAALEIPYTFVTGASGKDRLPGIASLIIEGVEGEALLLKMWNNGICASSGSACSSGSLDPSHVLLSIGLAHHVAHGSLRLSLNEDNTDAEADAIAAALARVAAQLREMSPVWVNGKPEWK